MTQKSQEHRPVGSRNVDTQRDSSSASSRGETWREALRALLSIVPPRVIIFALVFLGLALFFHVQSDGVFITPRNMSLLLRQASIIAILAAGVSVLMIKGEIDLSIGSAVFLCGVVSAQLVMQYDAPVWVAVVGAVAVGMALGLVQGIWVVFLGIPSFVATLAGLLAWRGAGLMWTNASTVGPVPERFSAISESFISPRVSYIVMAVGAIVVSMIVVRRRADTYRLARSVRLRLWVEMLVLLAGIGFVTWAVGGFQGLPLAVIWAALLTGSLAIVMASTRFGRSGYLLGSNRKAALYAGLDVPRTLFKAFILMGAIYGAGGVLLTARIGASTPGAGQFLELDAIAAAVIGGVSLRGGIGRPVGAVVGAILLTTINNGMSIINVTSFAQLVIKGGILVAALALDSFAIRRGLGK